MGKRSSIISAATTANDRAILKALIYLPDYQPLNPAYSREALLLLDQTLTQAEIVELQLDQNFEQARTARSEGRAVRTDTALRLHEAVLGFKDQVIAQYGPDSQAVALIGRVRKSARKRRNRNQAGE